MSNEEIGYYEVGVYKRYEDEVKEAFALKGLNVVVVREFQHKEQGRITRVKINVQGEPLFADWKSGEVIRNVIEIVAEKAAQMVQLREQNNE